MSRPSQKSTNSNFVQIQQGVVTYKTVDQADSGIAKLNNGQSRAAIRFTVSIIIIIYKE